MIYGLLGCPKFGVKGAAYATVIGQIISLAVAFIFHIKFNKDITNNVKNIKPSANIILNYLQNRFACNNCTGTYVGYDLRL